MKLDKTEKILIAIMIFLAGLLIGMVISPKKEIVVVSYNHKDCFVKAPSNPLGIFQEVRAETTMYNPVPEQTDGDPDIMASGKRVYIGAIACPREIPLGSIVEIEGEYYICEDRTAVKHNGVFDILSFSEGEAKNYGRQNKEVRVYK